MSLQEAKVRLKNKLKWLEDGGEPMVSYYGDIEFEIALRDGIYHVIAPFYFLFWEFSMYLNFGEEQDLDKAVSEVFKTYHSITFFDKLRLGLLRLNPFTKKDSMDI
jgi:hypothetical protein